MDEPNQTNSAYSSDPKPAPEHDKKQHHHLDIDTTNPPLSLSLLPADLEPVPLEADPTDTSKELNFSSLEKETVQADKETLRSSSYDQDAATEKEVGSPPALPAPDGWHAPWTERKIPNRICGVRAKVFWVFVVLTVVVFGLGIGLGMGLSKFDDDDDDDGDGDSGASGSVLTASTVIAEESAISSTVGIRL